MLEHIGSWAYIDKETGMYYYGLPVIKQKMEELGYSKEFYLLAQKLIEYAYDCEERME